MNDTKVKCVNLAAVFITHDVKKTADYYHHMLGFKVVKHLETEEKFATLYRDDTEIIVVQAKFGKIESNKKKYGAGYDVYLTPDSVEGVQILYDEFAAKQNKIISSPKMTDYGSYEFVIEDIDGRLIGVGRIKDNERFFSKPLNDSVGSG